MDWLTNSHPMPGIPMDPKNLKIIDTPEQFYELLLEKSSSAQNRISLSSLYLGDGELEKKLISTIENRLSSNQDLKVTVLLDFLRGTRGVGREKSSTTLLKPIADRSKIYLYHTPDLRGLIKRVLPERTNEIIGLQHMKLYIFDDSLLISGANLSDSYFTNRQDRYILFENCKEIADFFHKIIEAVGDCSFVLNSDGSVEVAEKCHVHPFTGNSQEYRVMLQSRISEILETFSRENHNDAKATTMIYPIIQIGILGIHQEFDFLKNLFSQKDEDLKITMASGYFNMIEDYENLIFNDGKYHLDVLTASPKANGFFGASGYSKYVPSMYSDVATKFLAKREQSRRDTVRLYEYFREGWTFHGKGLWIEQGGETATIVGSSNYGYRSVHRDLEAQVMVVTSDEDLRNRLSDEKRRLFEYSSILDSTALRKTEHHVPTIIRVISRFIRNFF